MPESNALFSENIKGQLLITDFSGLIHFTAKENHVTCP